MFFIYLFGSKKRIMLFVLTLLLIVFFFLMAEYVVKYNSYIMLRYLQNSGPQILCCITGLFGVCQMRMFLLIALTISTVVSICQNILIFLWYIGIFGDISRPVLSAGLPYAHSFFLKHTPFCGSRFDLQKSKWMQLPCALPYNQIEAAQALLHVILAAITLILSVIVILEKRRVKKDRPKLPLPAQYAQIKRSPQLLAVASSINDNWYHDIGSYDGSNDQTHGRPSSGTLTSLVSFDPKSRTLLRVREHRDSDDDDSVGYSRIGKVLIFELMDVSKKTVTNKIDLAFTKNRIFQDSVPSIMAPILISDELVRDGRHSSSREAGQGRWSNAALPETPGRSLFITDDQFQTADSNYKSNFRVEAKDRGKAIGHYHSVSEFRLTAEPPTSNVPIITGTGLLV
ncbi:unnamed protein product [Angiostrongylus costaricensis]|uniref:Sodium/potassium-transporting ATPase subunit beta-1-interacting protein n=1 Tax=Angiostrongylus costaricensis TaxID=334426 RepID=A0A0R3PP09_ANGCS|nr:unnamed protein product [Angiostrongylus costaricensis]